MSHLRSLRSIALLSASVCAGGCFAIADLDRFHEQTAGADADLGVDVDASGDGVAPSLDANRSDGVASTDARYDSGIADSTVAEGSGPETSLVDSPAGSYNDLSDPQRWAFFDVTGVGGATGYSGVVFDGRYLYFVPDFNPPNVLRYDTNAAFTDTAAWTFFAPTAAITAAGGSSTASFTYLGGTFDGRYVYFAPFGANTFPLQYDTHGSFSNAASWSAFQATTLDAKANYWGVVSDGRYAYFTPNATSTIIAYDNTAATSTASGFTSSSSWTAYSLGTGATYEGFWGGVHANNTVYLVPYSTNVASSHDTTLPVTSPTAWNVGPQGFDFSNNEQISPPHYWTGAFDGKNVYFIPYKTQSWTVASFDTTGSFSDDGSWSTCALQTQLFGGSGSASGFVGSAFDGKRLFLAPFGQLTGPDGGAAPLPVVAYDTTQPLCPASITSAYSTFDPTTLAGGSAAQGFEGAAFDGQYVYFVPHAGSVVARFQATSARQALAPSGYRGSWF